MHQDAVDAGALPARPWASGLLVAAVFVVLRAASLLEPTWYSDEGTYADIGHALLHGATLYRDVWDNKPPGVYWLTAAVDAVGGRRADAFPILVALLVAGGAVCVWRLGRRAGSRGVATLAAVVFVVLASLPNFEGDLFNAEILGAVLVLAAFVILTAPAAGRVHAALAGALVAAAVLCKVVFVFDLAAVLAVPWWATGARSWRAARPKMGAILVGAGLVMTATLVVLASLHSAGGLLDVIAHQDVDYVQLTTGPGGSVIQAASIGTRTGALFLLAARLLLPLAGLGVLAWRSARRGRFWPALVCWWLACDVAGAMTSSRGFSHYAQQATGVLALGAALVAVVVWRRGGLGRTAAAVAVLATPVVLQATLSLPVIEVAVANGRPFPHLENGSFRAAQLPRYYRLSWNRGVGAGTVTQYESLFPVDLRRQRAVVEVFDRYSAPNDFVFVWGTVHWSYHLSGRRPAGRYVSLNPAYDIDAGAERRLIGELQAHPPTVLVVDAPLPPDVVALVHGSQYTLLPGAAAGDDVWIAPWAPGHP